MTKLWMKMAEAIYENLSKGNHILLNCNLKFAKREPHIPGGPHYSTFVPLEVLKVLNIFDIVVPAVQLKHFFQKTFLFHVKIIEMSK